MDKLCGTCKYRGRPIEAYDEEYNEIEPTYFMCQRIKFAPSASDLKPGNGAMVQDGSGYCGRMCVETSFGCIAHEDA